MQWGFRLQAQCLQKCSINSLRCVCEFGQNALKEYSLFLSVCLSPETQHMHGYIYPAQQVCSKDSTDGPKDHLSTTCYTKDQHGPRRIILRGLMVEPWSNHIFRSPRRIWCILRGYPSIRTSFNCCPSQTGGWLTWSTYNTNQDIVYIRPNTDKVQTQVHQQTPPWL